MIINEERWNSIFKGLSGTDIETREGILKEILSGTLVDPKLPAYLEPLLANTDACILSFHLPNFVLCETRWLAAHALRVVFDLLGNSQEIVLSDITPPLDHEDLEAIAHKYNLDENIMGLPETLALMRNQFNSVNQPGYVPKWDIALKTRTERLYVPHPTNGRQMLTDEAISSVAANFERNNIISREETLKFLLRTTLVDNRLIPILEKYIGSRDPIIVDSEKVVELQLLVAQILARQKWALGITDRIVLNKVSEPIDVDELLKAATAEELAIRPSWYIPLAVFPRLLKLQVLSEATAEIEGSIPNQIRFHS